MSEAVAVLPQQARTSLVTKFAGRYGVDASKMMDTLKATAFKVKDTTVSNEQMMALMIVADQYGLNPFTREIYAFPDKGGIVPVVGVDGWARIINEHPQFDGMVFEFSDDSATCTIYRKDRTHPTQLTEYMAECKRGTQPWSSHPRRMLRHKAMIQCARMAFGFAGIYDRDEAERMVDMGPAEEVKPVAGLKAVKAATAKKTAPATIDMETTARPTAASDADPATGETSAPATTYAVFADRLSKTADAEIAALVMDEARELPQDQYDDLTAIYTRKFKKAD